MQWLTLIIIMMIIMYIIFIKKTKSFYNAIDKIISGELESVRLKQSLEQIRNIIQAQFKNIFSTDKTILFEYKNLSFIVIPLNKKEVLISLEPPSEEVKNFEKQEKNNFVNELLFQSKQQAIHKVAKHYAHIDLNFSFYIMDNGDILKIDAETFTISKIEYNIDDFNSIINVVNLLLKEPNKIIRTSSELGLYGSLLGLAIAGGIVQPLHGYPANGEYIFIIQGLNFKVTLYEDEDIEFELIIFPIQELEDKEIPF